MIRFAWLQFRTQAAVAFGVLAVVAVVAGVTGLHLVARLRHHGRHLPSAQRLLGGHCTHSSRHDRLLRSRARRSWSSPSPALIGIFWGAPLVAREFETGTFRLAWTQSVSRHPLAGGQARPGRRWPAWPSPGCSA